MDDFHRELITLKTINSDKNISQILILVPNSSSSPWLVGWFILSCGSPTDGKLNGGYLWNKRSSILQEHVRGRSFIKAIRKRKRRKERISEKFLFKSPSYA